MPYEKDEIKKALIMHAGTLILTDKKNLEGEEKNKHLKRRELVLNMFKNLSMFQKQRHTKRDQGKPPCWNSRIPPS